MKLLFFRSHFELLSLRDNVFQMNNALIGSRSYEIQILLQAQELFLLLPGSWPARGQPRAKRGFVVNSPERSGSDTLMDIIIALLIMMAKKESFCD